MKQLPLILLLAGCWSTASFGGIFDDTEARQMITDLKKQNQEQDAKSQAQQERLGKLETQLKNLRIIELFNQLEATRDEVKQLRGQLEVLNHQIEATQKRQKDFYVDLDSRVRQLEPGGGGNSTDKPAEPAPPISFAISQALTRCMTVEQAAEFIAAQPRWGAGLLMLADATGDIGSLELSSTCAQMRRPAAGEDIIFHTNAYSTGPLCQVQVDQRAVFDERAPATLRGRNVLRSSQSRNARFADTPVVMLSSKDGVFDKARGRMVGSQDYLTKPFTKDQLLQAVQQFGNSQLGAM